MSLSEPLTKPYVQNPNSTLPISVPRPPLPDSISESPSTGPSSPSVGEPDSFIGLLVSLIRNGIPLIPSIITRILIPLAVVTILNYGLMVIPTYTTYGSSRILLLTVVFITASYNGVVQRTIFWTILLTIGRKLFYRIRHTGFAQLKRDINAFIPNVSEAKNHLAQLFMPVLTLGIGCGLIFGNYLARNNRMDKQIVSIVVAFTIVGALAKEGRSLLVLALRLFIQDLLKLFGHQSSKEFTAKILLTGTALGLIGNITFAFIKLDSGGYILGSIVLIIGAALLFVKAKGGTSN